MSLAWLLMGLFAASAIGWHARQLVPTRFRTRFPFCVRFVDLLAVAFIWLFASILTSPIVDALQLGDEWLFAVIAFTHTLMAIGIPVFLHWSARVPYHQLGLHAARLGPNVFYGLAELCLWFPWVLVLNLVIRNFFSMDRQPHPVEKFLFEPTHTPEQWLVVIYTTVVLAPVLEELIFRGLLQSWLCKWVPAWLAIAVTAVLFGLAHGPMWPDPIPLTVLGIALGICYQRTRSLWAPAAFHAGFNAVMLLLGLWLPPEAGG